MVQLDTARLVALMLWVLLVQAGTLWVVCRRDKEETRDTRADTDEVMAGTLHELVRKVFDLEKRLKQLEKERTG